MSYNIINYQDIVNNESVLLAKQYSYIKEYKIVKNLQNKYDNIFSYIESIDGYAFSTKTYMPSYISKVNKVPLVQIGNVNSELCLSLNQKYEYVTIKELPNKKKYLLSEKGVLISLTGNDDIENDISTFFDNDFNCFLNQRVSFFRLKKIDDIDLLYYFYAFTKYKIFNIQWIGTGSVQKNTVAKERKKIFIPKINNYQTIKYVSMLMQAIINKEKMIKFRHKNIFNAIDNELRQNQKAINFKFDFPTINEIENSSRLDTGTYAEQFKEIDFLIKNYREGCFFLDKNHLKSGNTPNTRFIGDIDNLKYRWITPTHCSDNGLILIDEGINLKGNNNINENCLLLVNRGQGIDCGKSIFYNFNDYGKGHHNQGMYKVFNYEKEKLIFISCFLNTQLIREYCSKLSLGSKMKELKMEHFLQIPFPNFSEEKQKEIVKLYHNDNIAYQPKHRNLDNFLTNDNEFNKVAGIYEINKTAKQLKTLLNSAIDNIINDKQVDIVFD
ncbi:MAG: restriction endonuclease subunit S [Candidatus Cloacimonetes bacterium]|nr:restriction endonuclease subunit S [Candidatus Cloacimonadota bacterium]